MSTDKEIKDANDNNKLVIGSNNINKCLKKDSLSTVIYASNCPEKTKKYLKHHASISNIKIKEFDGTSQKMGEVCRKPFNIILIGIKK